MMKTIVTLFFVSLVYCINAQSIDHNIKQDMLYRVNQLRASGCQCGNTYMPPVHPVTWNEKLYRSSRKHAKDMRKHDYFSHFSRNGKSFEQRFDDVNYVWMEAGENIAIGQRSITEVIQDWVDSASHCRMIMNPRVNEMGMSKQGKYWVQHFGKQIPKGAIKKGKVVYIR